MSTGLVIGIPTLGRPVSLDWAFAFKSVNPPINFNVVFSFVKGKPVAEARNLIAAEAIKQNAKYLYFIGDDTIHPPHTLRQLIFRMENDPGVGIVGGVYFSKSEPSAPLVFRENGAGSYWDWKVGEYFQCSGLGMDCTLIRVDILKKLSAPWFHTEDSDEFLDGKNQATMWTEDLWFLERVAKETDYKIMCDASVICEHVDIYTGKVYSIPPYSLPTRRLSPVSQNGNGAGKKIIDLGCGPLYKEFEEGIPVRVDINEEWNPDYRCDIRNLPFENASFDIVYSSHVLEHFNRSEYLNVLKEWTRILKPDGELRLVLPNIKWAAERIIKDEINNDVLNVLYGAQYNQFDFHMNGFTPESLKQLLDSIGMTVVSCVERGYNISISAAFSKISERLQLVKTSDKKEEKEKISWPT